MIRYLALRWGGLAGRYGRAIINERSLVAIADEPLPPSPVVFACWHEATLIGIALHARARSRPAKAFVTSGLKGVAMTGWLATHGVAPVPLSGNARDGLALRRMLAALDEGFDAFIAADGPEGPRRVCKPGALWLAAVAKVPVVPVGCAAAPAIRIPRWDRHVVPLPGARVAAVVGPPVGAEIDPRSGKAVQEMARILNGLTARAQAVLAGDGPTPSLEEAQSVAAE